MNIQFESLKIDKTSLHKMFGIGFLLLVSLAGLALGIFFQMKEAVSHPLAQYLEDENEIAGLAKADFITGKIDPYTGHVSEKMSQCIASGITTKQNGAVTAQFDFSAKLNQTRSQILEDILPIFGYAALNGQLNWRWDADKNTYTFLTAPGDEKLWWCYFRNETTFFQTVFKKETVHTEFNRSVDFSFHRSSEKFSTTERELHRIFSTGEVQRGATSEIVRFNGFDHASTIETQRVVSDQINTVHLGYLHIKSNESMRLPFIPLNH